MVMYDVTWRIELDAEGPDDAAKKAREIQLDPDSLATVFEVRDENDNGFTVDVEDNAPPKAPNAPNAPAEEEGGKVVKEDE